MSIQRYIERIKFMDYLIRTKSTGHQKKFAQKVNISVSSLNIYISEMKKNGFPIAYDRINETYYYTQNGKMVSSLFEEENDISPEEMKRIVGGQTQASKNPISNIFFQAQ